jgi:hypothetical protein
MSLCALLLALNLLPRLIAVRVKAQHHPRAVKISVRSELSTADRDVQITVRAGFTAPQRTEELDLPRMLQSHLCHGSTMRRNRCE